MAWMVFVISIMFLVKLFIAAVPKISHQTQPGWGNFIRRKTIPNIFQWNSASQQSGDSCAEGATSPLWISVSVSLAFDKWNGRRWRRKGNVFRQKREGGWKRGILWLDVIHASVCVQCVLQVIGFYLSEGRHWGIHTHLDKCRSSTLAVNHNVYCKVHMCVTETKRDALCVCGCARGHISACSSKVWPLSFFYVHYFSFSYISMRTDSTKCDMSRMKFCYCIIVFIY